MNKGQKRRVKLINRKITFRERTIEGIILDISPQFLVIKITNVRGSAVNHFNIGETVLWSTDNVFILL